MPSQAVLDVTDSELSQSLLAQIDESAPAPPSRPQLHPNARRQSSFSKRSENGGPRTPNRVRFDLEEHGEEVDTQDISRLDAEQDIEEFDYLSDEVGNGQRAPLLTNIEAPSVAIANQLDVDPEDHLEDARPRSGLVSAFMNMANSIVGAGLVGQSYAFKQAGLVTGIVLLIFLTVIVDWTISMIVVNAKMSGANSFQTTMQHCFGRPGLVAISVAQWAFAFGGMIAFCIIVGDTIPRVLGSFFPALHEMPFLWLLTNRRAVIVLFILGLSYPLSLYRDIAKLAKASGLALISMCIIVITIITQGARISSEHKGELRHHLVIGEGVPQAIGVISFGEPTLQDPTKTPLSDSIDKVLAFVCHHNSLLIYGSLKTPTLDRFAQVTHYSTFASMLACMAVALSGFLTFGDKTMGNVLNNFDDKNLMVNIARLCFGLNMLSTLPLECFVCREVMFNYWFPNEPFNMNLHMIFTTALVVSAMTMALITCDLGIVFELVGATSACALAYILPPLCFIKLSKRSWKTYAAAACTAFGLIVMTISLFQAVSKMIRGGGNATECT